jgi:hypothetical protein
LESVIAKLPGAKKTRKGWMARCPAHEDRKPSLSVSEGDDGRVLVKCHVGCPAVNIVSAMNLTLRDLMPAPSNVRPNKPILCTQAKLATDWTQEAKRFAQNLTEERREALARQLLLPVAALDVLPLVGLSGSVWTFPECDGSGQVVGLSTRDSAGEKKMIRGSHRGLTIPTGWSDRCGPVFLPEGASDVLALTQATLAAVGRPSNTGGVNHLVKLLSDLPAEREVTVLGEHDGKGEGSWPGKVGAEKSAAELSAKLARPVRVAFPPGEYKDVREWVQDLAAGQGEAEDWPAIGAVIVQHCAATATLPPPGEVLPRDREPHAVNLSSVQAVEVAWLWPDRIPLGRITVLAGRPGCGKSIVSLDLAARVTRGLKWPDGTPCPQGSVLLLAAEDDLADTVRPRLDAAGADVGRVDALPGILTRDKDGRVSTSSITLADLDVIDAALEKLPDCRLVIVDPIGSYLGGRTDAHRDNEVRAVLSPLAELAARRAVAVVAVCHTRKGGAATHADDAVLGSVGFVGLARAVLHVVTDPDDSTKRRKLLLPGKNNLAPPVAGFAFHVEGRPPRVVWDGMTGENADDVLSIACRPGPDAAALKRAVEWLRETLASGSRLAKELQDEAFNGEGLSKATLDRAKKAANVEAYRPENPGPWYWRLPDGT